MATPQSARPACDNPLTMSTVDSPVTIREATAVDLPRLIELMAQLRPDDPNAEEPAQLPRYEAVFSRMIGQAQRILVAESDGRLAGALVVAIVENISHKGAPYAIIENVVVDESARGQRIGEALIGEAVEAARQAGCYKVTLTSNKRRTDAHRFYKRLGFVQTHEAFRINL